MRGGRGVPSQVEVRGREDRNGTRTFRRFRPYRTVVQGDSAIPGRRPTRATTSTITRDCDRPIDERKGLPTVQILSEAAKQVWRKEGVEPKPPRNKYARAQGHDKGSRAGGAGCSSKRVRVQLTKTAGVDVDDEFSRC